MEDDDQTQDYCGCDCESCMSGDHDHCTTGMCTKQHKDQDQTQGA